jgi:hypothetical protein
VQKAVIELWAEDRGPDAGARVVKDGVLAAGWRMGAADHAALDAALFERPSR